MSTTTTSEQIPTGTFALDPIHSSFGFAIRHNAASIFRGQFEEVDAVLEDGVLTGAARVDSVKTALPDLTAHLLSPEFFDAERTPTIEFRSTELRIAEDGGVEVDGELTMRGVTKPLTATGSFARSENFKGDEVVGLGLEATIDRREFGLGWQTQLPNGSDVLGWDVVLECHFELVKG